MLPRLLLHDARLFPKRISARFVSKDEMEKYKHDSAALAKWLDVSIVSRNGRAFDADKALITKSQADTFPALKAYSLDGQSVLIPDHIDAKAKLVVFSFKHYGFSLVRSWIDPFIGKYNASSLPATSASSAKVPATKAGAVAYEVCFVEYSFLSMAKSVFANNIRSNINPAQVNNTALVFGGVRVSH